MVLPREDVKEHGTPIGESHVDMRRAGVASYQGLYPWRRLLT